LSARAASFATLAAIACAAYLAADIAHEALGHGGACLVSGGRSLLVDTTFQNCSIRSRWIDGAGPVLGLAVALLAWISARASRSNFRIFFVLVFAYAAFWNLGYMVKSGIGYKGDWHFLIEGLEPAGIWHIGLTIAGVGSYLATMRMLAPIWPRGEDLTSASFTIVSLLAAAMLSAAAGYLDPRGTHIVVSDALPSSLASIGLVLVGLREKSGVAVIPSPAWFMAGLASATFFVAILGPGLRA
jgi:hypothetical protein